MASLFKQTTTYDPIFSLLNAESEERRDELTERWRVSKLEELNFVGIVGALLAGVLSSTGSWPVILPNGTRQSWTIRACWYCGLIVALTSVITAAQQAIRLHRLSCHAQRYTVLRRLLGSKRTNREGCILPRPAQVFAWQLSGWLLLLSALCLLIGMMILIWSSTLTDRQNNFYEWWNGEAKLAVTFTIVTGFSLLAATMQQWTLYSWDGDDDSDQREQARSGRAVQDHASAKE